MNSMADCLALPILDREAARYHLQVFLLPLPTAVFCPWFALPSQIASHQLHPCSVFMYPCFLTFLLDIQPLKIKPPHCLETLRTKYPMMQHHFPEEWLPHDDMYCQGPQFSHNTVVQKIVAEYQEQAKSRNEGYVCNSNHLTWSKILKALMKRDSLLCPIWM